MEQNGNRARGASGIPERLKIVVIKTESIFPGRDVILSSDQALLAEYIKRQPYFIALSDREPHASSLGILASGHVVGEERSGTKEWFYIKLSFQHRVKIVRRERVAFISKDDEEAVWEHAEAMQVPRGVWRAHGFQSFLFQLRHFFNDHLRLNLEDECDELAKYIHPQFGAHIANEGNELLQEFENITRETCGVFFDRLAGYAYENVLTLAKAFTQSPPPAYRRLMREVLYTLSVEERIRLLLTFLHESDELVSVFTAYRLEMEHAAGHHNHADSGAPSEDGASQARRIPVKTNGGKASGELRARYEALRPKLSDEVCREIEKELSQIESHEGTQAVMARDHLELLLDLFSLPETEDKTDIREAERIFDEAHWGLEKPKAKILEFLAVRKHTKGSHKKILCFVGPPGVGKTTLGRPIARALGRKFVRLSLGGFRDEAEIRGHGLTYVRTQPGQIIKRILKSGSVNPVFVLDELDKISRDFRGDPAAALLEVLDPEQNSEFLDHNVNVPFDLSRVLFICTANTMRSVPETLRDRLEVINISGYTPLEKRAIALRYLIPKLEKAKGFPLRREGRSPLAVSFNDAAIDKIIQDYTYEAGVRDLERRLDDVYGKVALEVERGEWSQTGEFRITARNVHLYAGKPVHYPERSFEKLPPGCAPMFAVTDVGGYFFHVETMMEPGRDSRKIKVTGVSGEEGAQDVVNLIEESADVAFDSLILEGGILYREPEKRKEEGEFYIHIHINDSATPKDGPSAGIPLLWALYGCLTKQSIRPRIGATGEIRLELDIVDPIGGLREKVLAAHRAGIKVFVLPKDNERDIEDIPPEVKEDMELKPVNSKWEALQIAFPDDPRITAYIENRNCESSS